MTNMKRSISDSEDEDCFDDTLKPGSPSQSGHGSDRKKRRGVIEKRRRDRINNSLSELRRLVPSAFEKQGSAKLEKAEILQMTVDHLKLLHSKGINGYNFDHAALAMDYRSVGFRECAAEVARYLVTVEGMDIQDPLRLRLMSHLQCYSAQREAAAKAHSLQTGLPANSPWNSVPSHHSSLNSQYNTNPMSNMPHQQSMIAQSNHEQLSSMTSHSHSGLVSVTCAEPSRLSQHPDSGHVTNLTQMRLPTTGSIAPHMTSVSSSSGGHQGMLSGLPQVHTQFPMSLGVNSMPMLSPSANHSYSSSPLAHHQLQSVKPYRPWGAELAY